MVNEKAMPDFSTGVDFNTGKKAAQRRDTSRCHKAIPGIKIMGQTITPDGKVVRHGISLRYTFANIQCKYDYDIEEALIDGSATAFNNAIRMLNSGTVKVASVKFRPIFKGGL